MKVLGVLPALMAAALITVVDMKPALAQVETKPARPEQVEPKPERRERPDHRRPDRPERRDHDRPKPNRPEPVRPQPVERVERPASR